MKTLEINEQQEDVLRDIFMEIDASEIYSKSYKAIINSIAVKLND